MSYSYTTEKFSAKAALLVFVIAFVIWLGGINIRAMVGYDLLQTGTLDFKPNIHPFVERAFFGVITQSSYVVDVAYVIAWFAGLIFLARTHLKMRQEGWLLMAAILFYLFTPVEVYAMILDGKMIYLDYLGSEDLVEYRKLFIHRLAALSGVPMIALLCYYTMIGVLIFQPLRRKLSAILPGVHDSVKTDDSPSAEKLPG